MGKRGRSVCASVLLSVVVAGCSSESGSEPDAADPTSSTSPSTSATASSSADGTPAADWPEEAADLRSGGPFWAVFLAVVPFDQAASLQPLADDARALDYNAASGDVCAGGADGEELPFDWSQNPQTVSVWFDSEADADRFVELWEGDHPPVAGVYEAVPACL
jgi:hypothetical protein